MRRSRRASLVRALGRILLVASPTVFADPPAAPAATIRAGDFPPSFTSDVANFPDVLPGVDATFTVAQPDDGLFETKTDQGATGVGIDGPIGGEISVGQIVTATFTQPVLVASIGIVFLFDGPEYSDPQEIALITADGGVEGTLATDFATQTASWTVPSLGISLVLEPDSPPVSPGGAGLWRIPSPFGNTPIGAIDFGALPGPCAPDVSCFPEGSDYAIESVTLIPEAQTALLVLAGLTLFAARGVRR
jgi:hypothetical protein